MEGCRGLLSRLKLGRELNRLSGWRKAREEVVGGSVGYRSGEGQREVKGESSGVEGAVSFDVQEAGLDIEKRKEKFLSNIVVALTSKVEDRKDVAAVRKTVAVVDREILSSLRSLVV